MLQKKKKQAVKMKRERARISSRMRLHPLVTLEFRRPTVLLMPSLQGKEETCAPGRAWKAIFHRQVLTFSLRRQRPRQNDTVRHYCISLQMIWRSLDQDTQIKNLYNLSTAVEERKCLEQSERQLKTPSEMKAMQAMASRAKVSKATFSRTTR